MSDDSNYPGNEASSTHKRKYDDNPTPPTRSRPTGFSSPNTSLPPPPPLPNQQTFPQSYNSVPPPVDGFQAAKQKAQEIAARLLAAASSDPKRPRVDNGSLFEPGDKSSFSSGSTPIPVSYGSYGGSMSRKIEIPNGRVGVIIGKGGETIKFLQVQSGAKIQVTRDMEADPNALMRPVELMGTPEQVEKAEQLINDVLSEADAGGSGTVSRRIPGDQGGSDHIVMKVPNSKVGLVIGKGGETIKNMQARTGARIQVIPLHLPPGDTSQERSVHIDGTNEQIEAAKQLVNEVISSETANSMQNRTRNNSMGGAYAQGYQGRPQANWGASGVPSMQQANYGYMQAGAYGQSPYQSAYAGYPQASGGYPGWDQTGQQANQAYDYYSQGGSQQGGSTGDGVGYNYNQGSGYMQAHGYDGYGGYSQSGYGGYDGYAYGQDGSSYGSQADGSQALPPPPAGQQPSPSQAAYGANYQAAKGAGAGAQQSPGDGYGQASYGQGQAGAESGSQRGGSYAQSGYGAGYGAQPGYGPSAYGPYGSAYPQGTYGSDAPTTGATNGARASYDSAPPPAQQTASAKSSQPS